MSTSTQWSAKAPANIALIKYMGKEDAHTNIPANPSLSYTLPHLESHVQLDIHTGSEDIWEPLIAPSLVKPILSINAQARFIKHLAFLKKYFNYTGHFKIQSANNFPHGTGLASSASSFAALTRCATQALAELTDIPTPSQGEQARLSRHGSGSSCRSFFAPWALWDTETAHAIELPYTTLIHQVILIHTGEKKVSSSEAHQRIKTSPEYKKRPLRATAHLNQLQNALNLKRWDDAYHICWQEFQEMHALFHTANPAFQYITPEANQALISLQDYWTQHHDGPIITMDAGPNIHLLYRPEQTQLATSFKNDLLSQYHVL